MALTRATDKIIANADGNLNLSGIVTASSFRGDGSQLTGIDASTLKNGSDTKAQANASGVVVTGVLTATSYSGDGSNLTNLPAGLGTALSSTQTSPLNKLYYTNEILSIGATVTVDHPATGTGAYTQYADIRLEEGADLIIEDGDDVIPDILGLGTDGGGLGAGGSGRIRVDSITNKNANGAPNFPNGLTGTAGTFTGNLNVGGVLTYEDVTNVDSVGVITARSGINVSGGGVDITTGGLVVTGISTTTARLDVGNNGTSAVDLRFKSNRASAGQTIANLNYEWNGTTVAQIRGIAGSDTTNKDDGHLAFYTTPAGSGSFSERLRIGSAGQLGIGGANYGTSGQVLTSQGSGSAIQWATVSTPVKEQFLLSCDGSSVSTSNGTYTTTNVTGTQDIPANNTTTFTGSEISYQPPTGTTCVIYEFISCFGGGATDGIWNTVLYIDGTQIVYSTLTSRGYSNGSSPFHFKWAINIGGSTNNSTGRQANWNSAKTLLLRVREYDANHSQVGHKLVHNQFGGGSFKQPQIGITALG